MEQKPDGVLENALISPDRVPRHVAVIMDGNGRWAKERSLPRSEGHRAGVENIHRVLRAFNRKGVRYLTLYAFSTENWNRPGEEVTALMELLEFAIHSEVQQLHKENVRLFHIGRLDRIPARLRQTILEAVDLTSKNTGLTLVLAFDYGGRAEIINAVRLLLASGISPDQVDEVALENRLYTHRIPDPDLILRTAGEMRLSNFLLWQAAYAEYYSTPVLWPDFDEEGVYEAIKAYGRRQRRFGRVP